MPIITQYGEFEEVIPWNHYPTTKEWRPKTRKYKKPNDKIPHNGNFLGHEINLMQESTEYKKIVFSKHNGKVLPNGEVRVGDDMKWNPKTGLISKYEEVI